MVIFCCGCNLNVDARLTDGKEIYPHRTDLHSLPFWKCDGCGNYVGCHHKHHDKSKRLDPKGVIPTKELMRARVEIHKLIDPVWQNGEFKRKQFYRMLSEAVGYDYHTAEIRSIEQARDAYRAFKALIREGIE